MAIGRPEIVLPSPVGGKSSRPANLKCLSFIGINILLLYSLKNTASASGRRSLIPWFFHTKNQTSAFSSITLINYAIFTWWQTYALLNVLFGQHISVFLPLPAAKSKPWIFQSAAAWQEGIVFAFLSSALSGHANIMRGLKRWLWVWLNRVKKILSRK